MATPVRNFFMSYSITENAKNYNYRFFFVKFCKNTYKQTINLGGS